MSRSRFVSPLIVSALTLFAPSFALADDNAQSKKAAKPASSAQDGAAKSQRTTAEVMKITQQTMAHVRSAIGALDKKDNAAAKRALAKAQQTLAPLYDTPIAVAILNELDEAIASVQLGQQTLKALDLAPLAASVSRYQVWMDPTVAAKIDEARTSAGQGDADTTVDALRMARNRAAMDLAFLPVEEAYMRIAGAQHALGEGDAVLAKKLLNTLPIFVAEVGLSTPLVPVRFNLNAAALAAEEGNWKRSRMLLREATAQMKDVEKRSKGTGLGTDASALVGDLEALDKRIGTDQRPDPAAIRQLAKRTRDLGA